MTLRQHLEHLPRDTRDTLFLLAVIAWVIAPQTQVLPLWTSAAAALLLALRAWLAWGGRALPGRWTLHLLLLAAVVGTLLTHRTIVGRDPGLTLIVMLLALKTLEARAQRDAMVIFFLGFFTLLSNFFYSQSLSTAAAMVVGLMGLLTALVNAHLPVGRPPLGQTLRTAGTLVLLGTPIMLALFLFFPRMAPLWGVPSDAVAGRTGLSGHMTVGSIAELALDDRIAFRLRFDDPGYRPASSELYFRGPVLTSFDGREWLADTVRDDPALQQRFGVPSNLQVRGPAKGYEVTLEPSFRPWLMLLEAASAPPQTGERKTFMTVDLQWLLQRPVNELLRYHASSHTDFSHGPLQAVPGLRTFTQLPTGKNPRTLALAAELRAEPALAQGGTPALVNAVLTRLRTGGYTYTLEPGLYGDDTADEFWFNRKEGFCEHIASAFVVLMRAAGVPARIVTGYQGGELNAVDGYWTVRQSDAHAWAEVWMAGRGWVRVDPTGAVSPGRVGQFQRLQAPQGALANAMGTMISPDLGKRLRALWEATNNRWNQWVLNYTQERQFDLLRQLGFDNPDWQDLGTLIAGLIVAASLGGMAWTLWERLQHDPWLRLLHRARTRLERAGLAAPAHAPPRTLAALALQRFGAPAQPLADWLLRLERLRYAPTHSPTAAGATTGVRNALRQLRRELPRLPWPTHPTPTP